MQKRHRYAVFLAYSDCTEHFFKLSQAPIPPPPSPLTSEVLIICFLYTGLFHKAIILSPISIFFIKETTESYSIDFVKNLGYKGDPENRTEMLTYLKNVDTRTLLEKFGEFLLKLAEVGTTDIK